MKNIKFVTGQFVTDLLIGKLPKELVFHNLHHTMNVVRGVRRISRKLGMTAVQREILVLAAWFHDVGFIDAYHGHEEVSKSIAATFLRNHNYPLEKLEEVLFCIDATKMPQNPKGLLQEVMCDADLYHLALPEYCHIQKLLLEEWRVVLEKDCSDTEWTNENLDFIRQHQFWTSYGQTELSKEKRLNIDRCELILRQNQENP